MEILILLGLSIGMFLGALLGGYIPLMFNFSSNKLRLITCFGTGLLIGCSLIIILPEGIETINKAQLNLNNKDTTKILSLLENNNTNNDNPMEDNNKNETTGINNNTVKDFNIIKRSEAEEDNNIKMDHKLIGLALISGFSVMFLIDSYLGTHSHSISDSHIGVPQELRPSIEENLRPLEEDLESTQNPLTALFGLLIHSAADGIALGAASIIEQKSLELILFIAILLHKLPAAFGLSTILLQKKVKTKKIIPCLLLFAAAAPIACLITYGLLHVFQVQDLKLLFLFTGFLLLFSAGTFLYVAIIHSLNEVTHDTQLSHMEIFCILLAMFFPLVLPLDD
ncbi:Zinc/iron permease [Neoconidiobolus thromboides FSU 785]|nr:Zinc/iron permease [Neoconidiobolus thromboides FSU 785]